MNDNRTGGVTRRSLSIATTRRAWPGAALALVHGRPPGRPGWRAPSSTSTVGIAWGAGHLLGPRVAVAEVLERGVHGEVRRA